MGMLQSHPFNTQVISVGNIQVGGAGKTPLVAWIARESIQRGKRVCILCRGYQGEWENGGGILYSKHSSQHVFVPASVCGDEAALLHELVPEAVIGVGADRVRNLKRILKNASSSADERVDLVILDDGFQHHRIKKDLEIVALTSQSRWKTFYRDWNSALKFADILIWTKGEVPPHFYSKPHLRVQYQLNANPENTSYWLVTGVAQSQDVKNLAEKSGYKILKHTSFPDHARYSKEIVSEIVKKANQEKLKIILTGKDWVKWREYSLDKQNFCVLEPEIFFPDGIHFFEERIWKK